MSMIPVNRKFLRGDIYYANLEPHLGSEQGGIRPVVVVQNNTANCYSPNLIVAPVTSNTAKKPDHQAHVLVDGNRAFLQPSICNELFTWADVYDTANHDERRAILQQFIKEIRVRKDYEISITLNASFNQVEQLKAVSTYDGAEIFEEISEKGA